MSAAAGERPSSATFIQRRQELPPHGLVGGTSWSPAYQDLVGGCLKVLDDLGGDDARRRKVNTRSPNGQVLIGGDNLWDTRWTGRHPMDRRWTAAQVTAPDRTGWTFGTVS